METVYLLGFAKNWKISCFTTGLSTTELKVYPKFCLVLKSIPGLAIYAECVENLKSGLLQTKICHLERFDKHPTCSHMAQLLVR